MNSKKKASDKKFTIELNEKQLVLIDRACELYSRFICGQLWLGPVQDVFFEAHHKTHPGEKFGACRDELEADMKMLMKKYWGLSANSHFGLGFDDRADTLWDIHKSCEHARYLAKPKDEQEALRWTVLADKPMAFGTEPLMKVTENKEEK